MRDIDVLGGQMRIIFGSVFLGKTQSSLFRRREFFVIESQASAPGYRGRYSKTLNLASGYDAVATHFLILYGLNIGYILIFSNFDL